MRHVTQRQKSQSAANRTKNKQIRHGITAVCCSVYFGETANIGMAGILQDDVEV